MVPSSVAALTGKFQSNEVSLIPKPPFTACAPSDREYRSFGPHAIIMKHSPAFLLKCALFLAALTAAAAHGSPAPPAARPSNETNLYANGRIIDITHQIRAGLPIYGNPLKTTAYDYMTFWFVFGDGKNKTQAMGYNVSTRISTHVIAPNHAIPKYQDAGISITSLDLETLNGPGLLVDVPRDKNITAEVLRSLNIPKGVKRVIFRTANTDRRLMWKPFESNYTGFTLDGADWLVKNSDIKLIGIDYLSVAIGSKPEIYVPILQVLLENKDIIPVEALNLENVPAGAYDIRCLPTRMYGADAASTRCILMK